MSTRRFVTLLGIAITLAALFVSAGCSSKATSPPPTMDKTVGYLQILVQDSSNAPLEGAKVVSQVQPDGQLKVTGITDQNGLVTFSKIQPGKYEFAVSQADSSPAVAAIDLAAGQPVEITVSLEKASTP
jgi:uncharacterized surface anchored protein